MFVGRLPASDPTGARGRLVVSGAPKVVNWSISLFTSTNSRWWLVTAAPEFGSRGIHLDSRLPNMLLGPICICPPYNEACWETEGEILGDIILLGKPFIILEDKERITFYFTWIVALSKLTPRGVSTV